MTTLNDHILSAIRDEVAKAAQRWTAWGTVEERTVGSNNALVTFDDGGGAMPVKVSPGVHCVPGDRVVLMRAGGYADPRDVRGGAYWVIVTGFGAQTQIKYATGSTTTSTSFADVAGLTGFELRAGARYQVSGYFSVSGAAAADLGLQWEGLSSLSTIANGTWAIFESIAAGATMWGKNAMWNGTVEPPLDNTGSYINPQYLIGQLTTGDDPLTADLQWRQLAASGTNTFHAGSYVEFREIPIIST